MSLMHAPSAPAQAEAALSALLGPGVAVVACDPRAPQRALLPGEDLPRATFDRLREFAAGRACARAAMAALGLSPAPLPMEADRAPRWPAGLRGSIAHSVTLCVAAVTREDIHIGIVLEPLEKMEDSLIPTICTEAERARLAPGDALRIFSAKEAVYKAQYPLTGALFDFHRLEVSLAPDGFTATFRADTPPLAAGTQVRGRQAQVAGHVLSAVLLRVGG